LQILIRHLPEVDVEPLVVCPPDSSIIPWCVENRIPFVSCMLAQRDRRHPFRWWSSVRQIRKKLHANKVNLVHSNQLWSYPAAGRAGQDLGLPRICHIRDEISPEAIAWYGRSGFDAVICISRHVEKSTSGSWPSDQMRPPIYTLLNPVELPNIDESTGLAARRSLAKTQLGVGDGKLVFGFIGQIIPIKGLQILLDALAPLKGISDWELIIAGRDPRPGAPHESVCRQKIIDLGLSERVRFIGYLNDVTTFYSAIDLLVVPSLEEPLGRVPLEAGAFGKASIAFAAGGLPETIEDGKTGILLEIGNEHALSQALIGFLNHPDAMMGAQARKKVEREFNPHFYVKELKKFYSQLINNSR